MDLCIKHRDFTKIRMGLYSFCGKTKNGARLVDGVLYISIFLISGGHGLVPRYSWTVGLEGLSHVPHIMNPSDKPTFG